jgi:hypothetical protein
VRRAALLAVLLLAPLVRADDAAGLQLARQARQKLSAGDAQGALELLDKARTELPGSPVVACTRGDALAALGRLDEALGEYVRASSSSLAFHAAFNAATACDGAGEAALDAAHVPADVAALPEGPQPEMLQALGGATPLLGQARQHFLDALDLRDDADARESVGAINRRLDALKAIEDELKKRQQDEHQKDKDKDKQDQQNQDQKDQQKQDQQQQQQDQHQNQDKDQDKDQDKSQDQQDQKQDQQQQDPQKPDDKDQQPQPQDAQPSKPDDKNQPPPQPAKQLSEQEVQQLLDTLAQLEDAARERAKAREMKTHRKAEKDW